jgi:hypothetical protein
MYLEKRSMSKEYQIVVKSNHMISFSLEDKDILDKIRFVEVIYNDTTEYRYIDMKPQIILTEVLEDTRPKICTI